ncbi:hypothetical protein D3C73_1117280 [compost metagenome]
MSWSCDAPAETVTLIFEPGKSDRVSIGVITGNTGYRSVFLKLCFNVCGDRRCWTEKVDGRTAVTGFKCLSGSRRNYILAHIEQGFRHMRDPIDRWQCIFWTVHGADNDTLR